MVPVNYTYALSSWTPAVVSFLAFIFAVFLMMAVLMFLTGFLGEKRVNENKLRPYESGIIPTGSAPIRYPVPFFLVAVFFLIFDVEGAFIFSWALAVKALGAKAMVQITFFIFVLLMGLVYIWCKGGLALKDGKDKRADRR
ncbi:MAG: NADH-quinone oxidoreductase subunit A [Desulfobacteraceae bacterium]|nr:NADH-quinone oxidoreductase subunit A [Desulfobacteraceae bacterium]